MSSTDELLEHYILITLRFHSVVYVRLRFVGKNMICSGNMPRVVFTSTEIDEVLNGVIIF